MRQQVATENFLDGDGKPAGGYVGGLGIEISWQNGPLGAVGTDERRDPNGAFVEGVIEAARQRIQWYQDNGYSCDENAWAIFHLDMALGWLDRRTDRRTAQGVEGTHEGS